MRMQVYSRLATGKFPDFPETAAMVAKVFHFTLLPISIYKGLPIVILVSSR